MALRRTYPTPGFGRRGLQRGKTTCADRNGWQRPRERQIRNPGKGNNNKQIKQGFLGGSQVHHPKNYSNQTGKTSGHLMVRRSNKDRASKRKSKLPQDNKKAVRADGRNGGSRSGSSSLALDLWGKKEDCRHESEGCWGGEHDQIRSGRAKKNQAIIT